MCIIITKGCTIHTWKSYITTCKLIKLSGMASCTEYMDGMAGQFPVGLTCSCIPALWCIWVCIFNIRTLVILQIFQVFARCFFQEIWEIIVRVNCESYTFFFDTLNLAILSKQCNLVFKINVKICLDNFTVKWLRNGGLQKFFTCLQAYWRALFCVTTDNVCFVIGACFVL